MNRYNGVETHAITPQATIVTAVCADDDEQNDTNHATSVLLVTLSVPVSIAAFRQSAQRIQSIHALIPLQTPSLRRLFDETLTMEFALERGKSYRTVCDLIAHTSYEQRRPHLLPIVTALSSALITLHSHHYVLNALMSETTFITDGDERILLCDLSHVVALLTDDVDAHADGELITPKHISRAKSLPPLHQLLALAPEQTGRVHCAIDARTDLYNLGALLYELVTGQMPFHDQVNADDTIACVHAIVAKMPTPPIILNQAISPHVNAIILRLLHKNSSERYQSVKGLLPELQHALSADPTSADAPFVLGAFDVSAKLSQPPRFYGRELELNQILQEVNAMKTDMKNRLICVSGPSGSGKSALIDVVREQVLASMQVPRPDNELILLFARMKFDQFLQSQFTCFGAVVTDLLRSILIMPTPRLQYWKKKLVAVIGGNGSLLIKMFPLLEQIIGVQPIVEELRPGDAQHRITLLLPRFLSVFTSKKHPLFIFFDDIQWADTSAISQICSFISHPDVTNLCIIVAYRSEIIKDDHYFLRAIHDLDSKIVSIHHIDVGPMNLQAIIQFCSDTLNTSIEEVLSLATILAEKSLGNILYALQCFEAYHHSGLISIDAAGHWQWDIQTLNNSPIFGNNIIDIIQLKIRRLSTAAQNLLIDAALIGDHFSIELISVASHIDLETCQSIVMSLVAENILTPIKATIGHDSASMPLPSSLDHEESQITQFCFSHDRIQQAAMELLDGTERGQRCFTIVKGFFVYFMPQGGLQLKMDNGGAGAGVDVSESERLNAHSLLILALLSHCLKEAKADTEFCLNALLLIIAVIRKLKSTGVYGSIQRFVICGMILLGLLSDDGERIQTADDNDALQCWSAHYELTFEMAFQYAEIEYVCNNMKRSREVLDLLVKRAQTVTDHVDVYHMLAVLDAASGEFVSAMNQCRVALRLLDTKMALQPGLDVASADGYFHGSRALNDELLSAIDDLLKQNQLDYAGLSHFSTSTNSIALLEARALSDQLYPAYITDHHTRDYIGLYVLYKAITTRSWTGFEGFSLACVGVFLVLKNRLRDAAAIAQLVHDLSQRFKGVDDGKALASTAIILTHWGSSFAKTLIALAAAAKTCLETGDVTFAGFALCCQSQVCCYVQNAVDAVLSCFHRQRECVVIQFNQTALDNAEGTVRALKKLLSPSTADSISVHHIKQLREESDEQWVQRVSVSGPTGYALFLAHCVMVDYILGDDAAALQHADECNISAIFGYHQTAFRNLFRALAMLRSIRKVDEAPSFIEYWEFIDATVGVFRAWSAEQPALFDALYLLLIAERSWTSAVIKARQTSASQVGTAMKQEVIANFRACSHALDDSDNQSNYAVEAVVFECFARFCYDPLIAKTEMADRMMRHSFLTYCTYRAERKIVMLQAEFPFLMAATQQLVYGWKQSSPEAWEEINSEKTAKDSNGSDSMSLSTNSALGSPLFSQERTASANGQRDDANSIYANLHPLDIQILISSTAAISTEIVFSRLLEKLAVLLLHHTGAEKVMILSNSRHRVKQKSANTTAMVVSAADDGKNDSNGDLDEKDVNEQWLVDAVATSDGICQIFIASSSVKTSANPTPSQNVPPTVLEYPQTIVNYVVHTLKNVVLSDASRDSVFALDPYVTSRHSKSVLCLPLLNGNELVNILYVEHNAAVNCFTPERLLICQTIAQQAVISIENALLYDRLSEQVNLALEATRKAEDSANAQSFFIAHVSHEIRTPMNAIIGVCRLLEDSTLTQEQGNLVEVITTSSNLLLTVICDILDLSRIEHNSLELEQQPFDLITCVENTLHLLYEVVSSKQLDFAYMIDPNVPAIAVGDSARIQQIILNLAGNACKFTPNDGGVMVSVRVNNEFQQLDTASFVLSIVVRDTGIGIAIETLNKLFQPFVQGDASIARRFGGTGLGLVIVKRLVEAMNGSIKCDSQLGSGTEFRVNIKLRSANPQLSASNNLSALGDTNPSAFPNAVGELKAAEKAVVWLICARSNTESMLTALIHNQQVGSKCFHRLEDAMRAITQIDGRPDLIIIDVMSFPKTSIVTNMYDRTSTLRDDILQATPVLCINMRSTERAFDDVSRLFPLIQLIAPYHLQQLSTVMNGLIGLSAAPNDSEETLAQRSLKIVNHFRSTSEPDQLERASARASRMSSGTPIPSPSMESRRTSIPVSLLGEGVSDSQSKHSRRVIKQIAGKFPLRIILAEDNLVNQKIMSALLKRMGYTQFDLCGDGRQVIEQCSQRAAAGQAVTCILMDVQMEVMDGLECSRKLRQLPFGQQNALYIIAQTANVSTEWRRKCTECGMNAFISKPIVVEQLMLQLQAAYQHIQTPQNLANS